jgi:hypothetical protein
LLLSALFLRAMRDDRFSTTITFRMFRQDSEPVNPIFTMTAPPR